MRKIILLLVILLAASAGYSQTKKRSVSTSFYTGIGYKFVYLTNDAARNTYPFFQLSKGDFLKEIDGYFGATINETYGVEFVPAYLFTNSVSSDGFTFTSNNVTRFYLPAQTRLFALPLNVRFKYFPLAKNIGSTFSKFYFGAGGGPIYINEEITNQIYADANRLNYLDAVTAEDKFWTGNFEIMVGLGSFAKLGYGFELSYRFIPLKESMSKPLVTNIANNFNSINFSANILFAF